MTEDITERLAQLEDAVRRASDAIVKLRDDNQRLRADLDRLQDERRQSIVQIDSILRDIAKLDLA
jgi:hypothetical protein